jgi:hypothetical protein
LLLSSSIGTPAGVVIVVVQIMVTTTMGAILFVATRTVLWRKLLLFGYGCENPESSEQIWRISQRI